MPPFCLLTFMPIVTVGSSLLKRDPILVSLILVVMSIPPPVFAFLVVVVQSSTIDSQVRSQTEFFFQPTTSVI